MSLATSEKKRSKSVPAKPALPYEGFPLFPHQSGQWCKKILGRHIYFGPWEDWQAALKLFQDQRDDLYTGKPLLAASDRCTVRDLVNRFLTAKQHRLDSGEITPRTFSDYKATCARIVAAFGKNRSVEHLTAEDFEAFRVRLAKTLGVVALANEIQRESGVQIRLPAATRPSAGSLRRLQAAEQEVPAPRPTCEGATHV